MILDYKNYSKGYRLKQPHRRWGRYVLVLAALGALYGALYLWTGHTLSQARKAAENGQLVEAQRGFESARKLRVRTREAEDGLGIVDLLHGNIAAARNHFVYGGRSTFDPAGVVTMFTERGHYAEAAQYGEYAMGWRGGAKLAIELAVAEAGLQRSDDSKKVLDSAGQTKDPRVISRRESLEKVLATARKSGLFDVVTDRANAPLASYPFGSTTVPADPEISGGLRLGGALSGSDLRNHTLLNIDAEYQAAAAASLGYPGGIVVVEPATGEVLAAVSNPPPGDASTNFAFEGRFEPGSIIKLITLSAALRADFDFSTIFPFRCAGMLDCEGQPFYDWAIHGEVKDIDQATAESCNIAFARIGLALGRDAIERELRRYGFDRPPASSTPPLLLGVIMEPPAGSLHTVHLAVGLEDLNLTTIHGALIAAALAKNGTIMAPLLVREKRTILQEPYLRTASAPLLTTEVVEEDRAVIVRAMTAAVESSTGTGRRAAVEGLPLAIKTGTSGRRETGLDSVILGFAPVSSPKIAFCIYAHGAGKAELEGARILHELLTRIKGRLQSR